MLFKNLEKLKPYQVEGANFALSNFYSGNRDKPGMGKTAQALLAICKFLEKNPNGRVLVVAPTSLRLNWGDEIEMWTRLKYNYFNHKKDESVLDFTSDVVVITYYQVMKFFLIINLDKFDFIVIDESHRFKNPKAKQTMAMVQVVKHQRPKYLLLLSGTPIKKKIQDLFVPLYLMAMGEKTERKITDKYKSYFLYCYRFTNVIKTPFGTLFKGVKNLEELKTYVKGRFIGRDPEKVLDLPEFIDKYVTVDYKEDPELFRAFTTFNGMVEAADSAVKRESAALKAPFTLEYVDDLLEQDVGPVVVFTDHIEPVSILEKGLTGKGWRVGIIMGGIAEKKRDETKKAFQAGELDVLLCTYGAASEGNTFTRACHLVLNDLNWVPETIHQAKCRIRRIGQKNRCVYHIIGGAIVDKKIWQSLNEAVKVINKVWS